MCSTFFGRFLCRPCVKTYRNGIAVVALRWLDTVFQGQFFPSLRIKYITINNDFEKLPLQLYQIKTKICYDQGCNDIGVDIGATKLRHYLFYLQQYFLVLGAVHPKSFTGEFLSNSCLDVREVKKAKSLSVIEILWNEVFMVRNTVKNGQS